MKHAWRQIRIYVATVLAGWSADICGNHASNNTLRCYIALFGSLKDEP